MKIEVENDTTSDLDLMIEPVPEFYVIKKGDVVTIEGELIRDFCPRLVISEGFIVAYDCGNEVHVTLDGQVMPPSYR